MEVTRTLGGVMGSLQMLVNLIAKNRELAAEVLTELRSMKGDFEFLSDVRLQRNNDQLLSQLSSGMQLHLQDLAYDIDDFIQDLCVRAPWGSLVLMAIGADVRPILLRTLKDFRERIKNIKDELPKIHEVIPGPGGGTSTPAGPSSSSARSLNPYAPEGELVGIKGPKEEIRELLSPRADPHGGTICVISIVGCGGSGKTALARALYEDDVVTKEFERKVWVVASDPSSADIVKKIREKLEIQATHDFPKDKRYLVFLDDVLEGTPLKDITKEFLGNVRDSRIILTTRVSSVARENSSGSYEYIMQGLDKEKSSELFCRKFWRKPDYSYDDKLRLGKDSVDVIVDKCDGLPIALISAAERLRSRGQNPKLENFDQVCQDLSSLLACPHGEFEEIQVRDAMDSTFAEMRRAWVEPYENQLNSGEKECLLYLSIFPSGHQINSKSLIRRLIAEGLIPRDANTMKPREIVVGDVTDCVRKLMYKRMIEPVPIRSYSNVAKRCQVHSIMLQFTTRKAILRNFVNQIHNYQYFGTISGKVRRLTVQSSRVERIELPKETDLSVLRSLAIFHSGILNIEKCRRVRVLDLEDCSLLTREYLDNICGFLFLKYLRLRNACILEFPGNVTRLMWLETLDTRDTPDEVVIKLPLGVLMLPRFAYLFGKFVLTDVQANNTKELTMFLKKQNSQLHTLGGIVVQETKDLEIVLLVVKLATKLKKVKVWYRDTPSSRGRVTNSTLAVGGTSELPRARPLVDSNSNTQDTAPTTSIPLAEGTQESNLGATGPGLSMRRWNTLLKPNSNWLPTPLFRIWKLSTRPSEARRHGTSSRQGSLADYNSNAQDPAPRTSTPVAGGTPGLPSEGPSIDSNSNAQDRTPTTSTPLAEGTPEPILGATGPGLSTDKWKFPGPSEARRHGTSSQKVMFTRKKKSVGLLSKWKLSAGGTPGLPSKGPSIDSNSNAQDPTPATPPLGAGGSPGLTFAGPSAHYISNAQDPAPTTSLPVVGGTPGLPSKRPSADSSSNAQDPTLATSATVAGGSLGLPSGPSTNSSNNAQDLAPATSTTLVGGTPESFPCVSRLAQTFKERSMDLKSVSVDFNGVPNTFLDFLETIGTISSIKLRKGLGSLPGLDKLGKVSNLKKLHLFSTGLTSEQLASLQHLKCLQYLKLAEEGPGLWDSEFHVQERGFISLIWLCFESSNSKPPPLKIDEGVTTPLASLLLLCKESHPQVEGISHLAKLNEVILHSSASDDVVTAWKEEAKKHINRPYVEKKQD